ncbi:MAG: PorP/SprF family type IX secretion system membrane protein [Candidatus Cyclobacteriaceae bacterium M3_2C_046]
MKSKFNILAIFFCCLKLTVSAQQMPVILHFTEVPSLINPAYTGYSGFSEIDLLYKKLWIGIPGTTESQFVNLQTFFPTYQIGIGFKLSNDINNFLGYTCGAANLAYRIRIRKDQHVSLGLAPTISFHRIYFDRLTAEDPYENTILERAENTSIFDLDFGFSYNWNNFNVGFAALQGLKGRGIFQTEIKGNSLIFNHIRHFQAMSSYQINLTHPDWKLKPAIIVYSPQGQKSLWAIAFEASYQEKVTFTPVLLPQTAAGIKTGMLLDNQLKLGYAFELPFTGILNITGPTHEIMLGYRFGKLFKSSRENEILADLKKVRNQSKKNTRLIEKAANDSSNLKKQFYKELKKIRLDQEKMISKIKRNIDQNQDSSQLMAIQEKFNRLKQDYAQNISLLKQQISHSSDSSSLYALQNELEEIQQQSRQRFKTLENLLQQNDSLHQNIMKYQQAVTDLQVVIRDVQISLQDSLDPVQLKTDYYAVIGAFKTMKYAKIFQHGIRKLLNINGTVLSKIQDQKEYFVVYCAKTTHYQENIKKLDIYKRRILLYEVSGYLGEGIHEPIIMEENENE